MFRQVSNKRCKENCSNTSQLCKEVSELKNILLRQNLQIERLLAQQTGNATNNNCTGGAQQQNENNAQQSTVCVQNPNLKNIEVDYLYHLALDTKTHNFPKLFGDVRFVCLGGTPERMEKFAYYIMNEIGLKLHSGACLRNISEQGNRYAMYKVGPVLSVSHGMGTSSMGILLNELIKLCHYAKCQNPIFFRMGTCGGIDIDSGTLVITTEALDGTLKNAQELIVLGKPQYLAAQLDGELAEELASLACADDGYQTVLGKTICTNDFYEGQARLDGAFCDYTQDDKINYLCQLKQLGVKNIEMESSVFALFTQRANIRSAVVCVAILNRVKGDQICTPKEKLTAWEERPQQLVARFIRKTLFGPAKLAKNSACAPKGIEAKTPTPTPTPSPSVSPLDDCALRSSLTQITEEAVTITLIQTESQLTKLPEDQTEPPEPAEFEGTENPVEDDA